MEYGIGIDSAKGRIITFDEFIYPTCLSTFVRPPPQKQRSGKIASIKCNGIITYFIAIVIFKIHQPTCYFNDNVRYVYKYMFVFHLYEIIDLNSISYVKGNL